MLEDFYAGRAHHVYRFVLRSGRSPVDDYLEALMPREQDKLVALIKRSADVAPPFNNRERCKPIEGTRFFEFKTHSQRMVWCWGPGRSIVLLHGFSKRQARIPSSDLDIAHQRYAELEN